MINDNIDNWLKIIEEFGNNGVPSYECHQRHIVYCDCIRYGFNHIESWDCAVTCNKLPKITFKVSETCQKLV
jgi:hypothetical protein